jgi:hypothetical protein
LQESNPGMYDIFVSNSSETMKKVIQHDGKFDDWEREAEKKKV